MLRSNPVNLIDLRIVKEFLKDYIARIGGWFHISFWNVITSKAKVFCPGWNHYLINIFCRIDIFLRHRNKEIFYKAGTSKNTVVATKSLITESHLDTNKSTHAFAVLVLRFPFICPASIFKKTASSRSSVTLPTVVSSTLVLQLFFFAGIIQLFRLLRVRIPGWVRWHFFHHHARSYR